MRLRNKIVFSVFKCDAFSRIMALNEEELWEPRGQKLYSDINNKKSQEKEISLNI